MAGPVDVAVEDIAVDWSDLTLAGSLHRPSDDGPHPAIVMIQGSGPADRDSDGYFVEIRQAFLDRGIATCAVDKPGCGASTGDWREHDLAARREQMSAVIAAIGRHPGIDPARVGVWGQSQGGWIVQQLAADGNGLACAIANSGPSIGVAEQDLHACEHTMRRDGFDDADIDDALAFTRSLHQAARDGVPFETVVRELVAPVADRPWYRLGLTADDEGDWELVGRFLDEDYRPVESLSRIAVPFLAVFGGLDVLVPAWRGVAEVGTALAAAGAPDAAVTVFPLGDHRIRVPGGAFAPGYLDLLGSGPRLDWRHPGDRRRVNSVRILSNMRSFVTPDR